MGFLNFTEIEDKKTKTKQFYISNNNNIPDILGYIVFFPAWRKFVFKPYTTSAVFDQSCLIEIGNFCNEQTNKWRESLKEKKNLKNLTD